MYHRSGQVPRDYLAAPLPNDGRASSLALPGSIVDLDIASSVHSRSASLPNNNAEMLVAEDQIEMILEKIIDLNATFL